MHSSPWPIAAMAPVSNRIVSIYISAMGRLAAGVKPTPHKERQKIYRKDLTLQGGRRVIADLEPEGAQALSAIMEREKLTIKEAVTTALTHYANKPKQA